MSHLDFDEDGKETPPLKEDEFQLQLKRVIDAPFQKDKMIMIKSLYSYVLVVKGLACGCGI